MIYVLGLMALCAAWLLPGHYFPWPTFQQGNMAASGVALVALAAILTGKQRFGYLALRSQPSVLP